MLSRMTNANEQSESALGIDIGGSSVKAVIVRGDHIHAHAASDTYSLPSETVLRDAVSQAVDRLGQVTATLAGVCAPGVLDAASKQVTHSVNVPGLVGTDLDKLVRQTVPNVRTVEVCTDTAAKLQAAPYRASFVVTQGEAAIVGKRPTDETTGSPPEACC